MGFRANTYAKVWEVSPFNETSTKIRLSISRKNKMTGEYEQDFSGYVMFVGTAAAAKAAKLKEGDKIKLGDVDVTTKYDKEKKITYTNYKCFSFELDDEMPASHKAADPGDIEPPVPDDDSDLPF